MGLEMTDGERCRRWNRQDLLKDGLPSGTRHAGGPGFWFGQVDEEEGVHYDGDTGREAGREQGEAMPVWGIPSLRDLWDNHMGKKNHHWKRGWKLPEIQRNLTTTTICRVAQFME